MLVFFTIEVQNLGDRKQETVKEYKTYHPLIPSSTQGTEAAFLTHWGVIIAIATTGLGVVLVVKKNLNLLLQIPQITMPDRTLLKENLESLERSLLLSLSDSTREKDFYRKLSINSKFSIDKIEEEVFLTP